MIRRTMLFFTEQCLRLWEGGNAVPTEGAHWMLERGLLFFRITFFGKQIELRGSSRRDYTTCMWGKGLVSVVIAAVVGLYWTRPDLMVALVIVWVVVYAMLVIYKVLQRSEPRRCAL